MLLQFSVENYRSFRDEAVLSMMVPSGTEVPGRSVVVLPDGQRVFRVAAVYGANASGKSNLVRAMRDVGTFAHRGTRAGQKIAHAPFRLNGDSVKSPTRASWIFRIADAHWTYGIEFDRERVAGEYLAVTQAGDAERTIFERSSDDKRANVIVGDWWPKQRQPFISFVAEGTRANQPFLAEVRERVVDELQPVIAWFESMLAFGAGEGVDDLAKLLRENELLRLEVDRLVCGLVDGVTEVKSVLLPVPDQHMPVALMAGITEAFQDAGASELRRNARPLPRFANIDGAAVLETIQLRHCGSNGDVVFDVSEESDGTKRLLHLAPLLFLARDEDRRGSTFVVDELDRSLHSLLSARFIDRFLDTAQDSRQLIFTTHDTYLLHGDLIPPACVWFTEKHPLGSSTLYSLAEFKQQQIDHFVGRLDDGYLQGRFGAIPFVARRESLRWSRAAEGEREAGE